MKTVVFGGAGFIGRHFLSSYRVLFPDTICTSSHPSDSQAFFDLRKPDIAHLRLREQGYTWGLIACGMTGVAQCESDKSSAYSINVEGTMSIIRQLTEIGIIPIFLSSDYVFDGDKGGYAADASRHPQNVYGQCKAEVEEKISALCNDRCLVARLSKIYGLEYGDGTLIDDMARHLLNGDSLRAATDQVFCPTFIGDVVEYVEAAQNARMTGIINCCAPEAWSRFDIARALAEALHVNNSKITPIALDDLKEPFKRPKNTSMKPTRLASINDFMTVPEAIGKYAALTKEKKRHL